MKTGLTASRGFAVPPVALGHQAPMSACRRLQAAQIASWAIPKPLRCDTVGGFRPILATVTLLMHRLQIFLVLIGRPHGLAGHNLPVNTVATDVNRLDPALRRPDVAIVDRRCRSEIAPGHPSVLGSSFHLAEHLNLTNIIVENIVELGRFGPSLSK